MPTVEAFTILACLGGCTLALRAALLSHVVWALAVLVPLLAIFGVSLWSLIRNRGKRIPVLVNGWLWLLFVYSWLVLNWGLGIGGVVSTSREMSEMFVQTVDRSGDAFQVGMQFFSGAMYGLAAGFILLAVVGWVALRRDAGVPVSVEDQP